MEHDQHFSNNINCSACRVPWNAARNAALKKCRKTPAFLKMERNEINHLARRVPFKEFIYVLAFSAQKLSNESSPNNQINPVANLKFKTPRASPAAPKRET